MHGLSTSKINSRTFPGHFTIFSNSRTFPVLENILLIFQVFQDVWEPCLGEIHLKIRTSSSFLPLIRHNTYYKSLLNTTTYDNQLTSSVARFSTHCLIFCSSSSCLGVIFMTSQNMAGFKDISSHWRPSILLKRTSSVLGRMPPSFRFPVNHYQLFKIISWALSHWATNMEPDKKNTDISGSFHEKK